MKQKENLTLHQVSLRALFPAPLLYCFVFCFFVFLFLFFFSFAYCLATVFLNPVHATEQTHLFVLSYNLVKTKKNIWGNSSRKYFFSNNMASELETRVDIGD